MPIGVHNVLAAAECAHQHQQRRLRQMKIRQQRLHYTKLKSWRDEDVGAAGMRRELVAGERAVFQGADGRGSSSDDAAAFPAGGVQLGCGYLRQRVPLRVQVDISTRSTRTGWKVPRPTWSVMQAMRTPRARIWSRISGVKCRPAVGAATDPRSCA